MLACISCAKQVGEGENEEESGGGRGAGIASKDGVKSLSSQLKEMALKLKPTATSKTTYKKGDHRHYPDFDIGLQKTEHPRNIPSTSSSTPPWNNFPATGRRQPSTSSADALFTGQVKREEEWIAQVEPGVHITFMSLTNGGNDLKRIRFSREMFDKWQAQRWWGENYGRILELYNVQRFSQQALQTPARSEDERDSSYSMRESPMMTPAASTQNWMPKQYYQRSSDVYGDAASQATSSEREETSVSHGSEMESEWVEEDEPGVYVTIRLLTDGTKELRRVRFSRERFGEVNAKSWWEQNRERIQEQYL